MDRIVEVVAGAILLLTIVIPWTLKPERDPSASSGGYGSRLAVSGSDVHWSAYMSWTFLSEPGFPGSVAVFVITSWVVGLGVVVAAFCAARGL